MSDTRTTQARRESVDGCPTSGEEATIADAASRWLYSTPESRDPLGGVQSTFAIALHMHQPLIPAGGADVRTAALISNLQFMFEHPDISDNHNAQVFRWCYRRMGQFIPQLIDEGAHPRVMPEYSGAAVSAPSTLTIKSSLHGSPPPARTADTRSPRKRLS